MPTVKRISFLESLLLLILGGFALVFLLETSKLNATAALFPRLVAVTSLFLLVTTLGFRFIGSEVRTVQHPPNVMSFSTALSLQGGYIAMVVLLGFPIATLMYLLGSAWLMRYRRWRILIPYGVLLTSAVFVAFVYLLHVRLPAGLLKNGVVALFAYFLRQNHGP